MTAGSPRSLAVPRSSLDGICWPAVPKSADNNVLALLHQLEQSEWWPRPRLQSAQRLQLEHLLGHAARTVPFYRNRLRSLAGVRRGSLRLEHIQALPLLTRADIQGAGDSLHSVALPKEHGRTATIRTSGSTGQPVSVRTTQVTNLFFRALNLRYHLWHGRDFAAKAGSILRQHARSNAEAPANWVPGHASGPMIAFDVTHPLGEQLEWLLAEEPSYLLTYPGNLRALVEHAVAVGRRPRRLLQVATMGEILDASLRDLCRRAWGVAVTDAYKFPRGRHDRPAGAGGRSLSRPG